MTARIVRHNGLIIREDDLTTYFVSCGSEYEKAKLYASRAPTWSGNPLSIKQYGDIVARMNREDEQWVMASEKQNCHFI